MFLRWHSVSPECMTWKLFYLKWNFIEGAPKQDNKTPWVQDDTFLKQPYIFWILVPEIVLKSLMIQNSSSAAKQMKAHQAHWGYRKKMNSHSPHNISRRESSLVTEIIQGSGLMTVKIYVWCVYVGLCSAGFLLRPGLLHKR